MTDNIIENKSFEFAVRIVNLYKYLNSDKKEFVLSKQLLRSGTSIGANISEAVRGQSKSDFIAKMSIALKEANESLYWIKLLNRTEYISEAQITSLETDITEIIKYLLQFVKPQQNNFALCIQHFALFICGYGGTTLRKAKCRRQRKIQVMSPW